METRGDALEAVESELRRRADRGVFRSFAAKRIRGKLDCSLVWLKERPLRLVFDPKRGVLEFRDLLPNAAAEPGLYGDFRRFLKERTSGSLPPHRGIDPERIQIRRRTRAGTVSISLESLDGDTKYAVGKALQLVNEIFLGFLKGPYHQYMAENFREPEE